MDDIASSSDHIILDACCIINLYASRRMGDILKSIRKSIAVTAYVRDVEALRIYDGPEDNIRSADEKIDLQPLIDAGLLEVVSLNSEDEENTFVGFASILGDDGEAITGAIAIHRGWIVGTDDRKAGAFFSRCNPPVEVIATLELIKYWADVETPSLEDIKVVLRNVRLRASYEPDRKHILYGWWQKHFNT